MVINNNKNKDMSEFNVNNWRSKFLFEGIDELSDKQKAIAKLDPPEDELDGGDFKAMRAGEKPKMEGESNITSEQKIVERFLKKLANEFEYSTKDAARFVKETISKLGLDEAQMNEGVDMKKLEVELAELHNSEMWQAGRTVRSLRPENQPGK
jgi:hypothetical protein